MTTIYFLVFIVLALQTVSGLGWIRALGLDPDGPETLGYAWVAGFVATGIAVTISVVSGNNRLWYPASIVLLGAGPALAVARNRASLQPLVSNIRLRLPLSSRIVLGAAIILSVVLLGSAAGDRLIQDGWSLLAIKARALTIDALQSFYTPGSPYLDVQADYPLGMSATVAFVSKTLAIPSWSVASFVGFFSFLMMAAIGGGALFERVKPPSAAFATLGFVSAWGVGSWAMGGMIDVLISLSVLGMAIEFERMVRGDDAAFRRLALFAVLATLAKNEGLFFATILGVFVGGYLLVRDRSRLGKAWVLLLPGVVALIWKVFLMGLEIEQGQATQLMTSPTSTGVGMGVRLNLYWIAIQGLWTAPVWFGLLFLVPSGAAIAGIKKCWSVVWTFGLMGVLWAAFTVAYLRMSMDPVFLAKTALPRLWGDVAPALVYLSILGAFGFLVPADRDGPGGAVALRDPRRS